MHGTYVLQATENWAWPENEANTHVLDLIVLSHFANGTVSPSHQIHYVCIQCHHSNVTMYTHVTTQLLYY